MGNECKRFCFTKYGQKFMLSIVNKYIYYPLEVSSMKYICLGHLGRNTSEEYTQIEETHKCWYSWVVKIRITSEAVLRPPYTPWPMGSIVALMLPPLCFLY